MYYNTKKHYNIMNTCLTYWPNTKKGNKINAMTLHNEIKLATFNFATLLCHTVK